MPSVEIRNRDNRKVGEVPLDDLVFAEKPKKHAVYEEVKRYLASLRGGNAATKTRAEVSGAGRKLWKQKGTGRARVGSIRSPLWRHGGTTHGPQPHTYDLAIPKKVKKLAMRVALSEKLRSNEVTILESVEFAEAKTRSAADLVRTLALRKNALIVEDAGNRNLRFAARNHPQLKVVSPSALSVHDVLKYDRLILTPSSAGKLVEIFRP